MKKLQDLSFSSVDEKKSFDENSSQELSLESLSEISGGHDWVTYDRKQDVLVVYNFDENGFETKFISGEKISGGFASDQNKILGHQVNGAAVIVAR